MAGRLGRGVGSVKAPVARLAAVALVCAGGALAVPASASAGVTSSGSVAAPAAAQPLVLNPPAGRDYDDFHASPAYAKYYRQRIVWSSRTCPRGTILPLECAKIKVPRDWYHASAGDITVGISRIANQPRRARLLLSNPGGPGGDGLEFAAISALLLGITQTHTAIGIDPRGVGLSTRLLCPKEVLTSASYRADGDSRSYTRAGAQADAAVIAKTVAACKAKYPTLLPFINSDQTARDFNLVRALLRYPSTDYYGVSYGTWLGSVLEKLFPTRAARIVLDANADWAGGSFDRVFSSQPESFQAQFDRVFLPWLGRHNDVYGLGANAAEVNDTYERLRGAVRRGRFGVDIKPDLFDAYLAEAQYTTYAWDEAGSLMKAMIASMAGDADSRAMVRALLGRLAADQPTLRSVFMAVRCNDTGGQRSFDTWFTAQDAAAHTYPLIGAGELANMCASWPYRLALWSAVKARPVSGVLMLQTEADPATGYAGALSTRQHAAGTVRMVAVDDAPGHGAALLNSDCAATYAARYLALGKYPSGDRSCQGQQIFSGNVADTLVYEFFNSASADNPLPEPYHYTGRDFGDPAVDPSVPEGNPLAAATGFASGATPSPTTGTSWAQREGASPRNQWADLFAELLRKAQAPVL